MLKLSGLVFRLAYSVFFVSGSKDESPNTTRLRRALVLRQNLSESDLGKRMVLNMCFIC